MLDLMFEDGLSDAEIKAIAKARGFPAGSGASRSAVKNLFLSSVGIDEALASLDTSELAILWLLSEQDSEPDVSFFERLYHKPDFSFTSSYMLSFNQRYSEVFKTTREKLVRKGILIMAANRYTQGTRLEQWRFALPPAVIERLPRQVRPLRLEPDPAEEINTQALTLKLLQLAGVKQTDPLAKDPRYPLSLENGSILAGKNPLNQSVFFEWQVNNWSTALEIKVVFHTMAFHPALAIIIAVADLQPDEWFLPRQLNPLLKIRCYGVTYPKVEDILEAGWKWGLFARRERDNQRYYSPRFMQNPRGLPIALSLPDPSSFIHHKNDQNWVDLETVPPAAVAVLNEIAFLELSKGKDGKLAGSKRLTFTPNLVNLANHYPRLDQSPLAMWLVKNLPDFEETYTYVQQSWGKTMMHNNLYVARISSFALMIQIERAFRPGLDYVRLSDQWLAFRKDLLPEVEKLVKKAEFVIKKVTP